jgi:transcriptional regulator with XRE-family HTH domain
MTKNLTVAGFVAQQINLSGKTQAQIAEECGFDKANVITMIKQGKTKVPIGKIGRLAKALDIDPVFFLKMCLQEYNPDMMEAIVTIIGTPVITRNEYEIIEVIRESKVANPRIANDQQRLALLDVVNQMDITSEYCNS